MNLFIDFSNEKDHPSIHDRYLSGRDTSPVRFLKRDDRRHPFSQSAGGEPCRFQMYRFSMVLQGESASDKGSCAI